MPNVPITANVLFPVILVLQIHANVAPIIDVVTLLQFVIQVAQPLVFNVP